ncbi:Zinc finger CCCH domain-containing protein 32 [Bienertia sinuspersici]
MELYGRNQGSEVDPPAEWGETGLEESMWRLGLAGRETYPERPGVSDCVYYMRTGFCGFGTRCRYNHPRDRAAAVAAARLVGGEFQNVLYYLKTGTCKFGTTCKFHHPRNAGGSLTNAPLNIHGCPLRPGEKECSYYLKTGQCKFGITCKFHHPQPAGMSMPAAAPPFIRRCSLLQFLYLNHQLDHPPAIGYLGPLLYMVLMFRALMVLCFFLLELFPCQAGFLFRTCKPCVISWWSTFYWRRFCIWSDPLSPSTPGLAGSYPLPSSVGRSITGTTEHKFPERPGEPECQYYLKTGNCKFGASCRYHHPPDRGASAAAFLGPLGLPLRPGTQPCTFYMQNGYCKFGPTCKFDHPVGMMKYSPSASSLTETPVAPYLAGSSFVTLPHSSSSTELLPEYALGPQRDTLIQTTSTNVQRSAQGSALLSSRSIGEDDEGRHSS